MPRWLPFLLTDGQHNAGLAPESLVKAAQDAEVPIYPIGLGSKSSLAIFAL